MAVPRSSTRFAKTIATTTPKSPAQAVKKSTPKRAVQAETAARKPGSPAAKPATDTLEAAQMLHELRVNGQALSAQIARLAHRFL